MGEGWKASTVLRARRQQGDSTTLASDGGRESVGGRAAAVEAKRR